MQEQWENWTGELESQSGIDIEADVLPWLGPEIAWGQRNLLRFDLPAPEWIVLAGTTDKSASDAFFFDKLIPVTGLPGWNPATGTPAELQQIIADHTAYYGWIYGWIMTLTFPEDYLYFAFTDDYIIFCVSPTGDLFYDTLNLILAGGACLADTENFAEAQTKLPEERVLMFYCSVDQIWAGIPRPPEIPEEIWDQIASSLPPYMTGSLSFDDSGIISSFYYPLPPGMTLPAIADNMLYSSQIVPEDAMLFYSTQDINASWLEMKPQIEANWDNIRDALGIDPAEWPPSFADALTWVETEYGIDVDQTFGLMDQELALAMLEPIPFPDGDGYMPTFLIMNELSDTDMMQVPGLMLYIEGVINNILLEETGNQLVFVNVAIDGITARMPTTASWEALVGSGIPQPGYMFLEDVPAGTSTTNFMVIGFEDGLEAAVAVYNGVAPSLSEAGKFQTILSMLPDTRIDLGYINISETIDTVLSHLEEGDRAWFETQVAPFTAPIQACGSSTGVTEDGITTSGALYLVAVPTLGTSVAIDCATVTEGETADVDVTIVTNDPDGIGSATITLSYDSSVVNVEDVFGGDLGSVSWSTVGSTTTMTAATGASPGPTGSFLFATVRLHAVGSVGESSLLDIEVTSLYDGTAGDPQPITPYPVTDCTFSITSRLEGDVHPLGSGNGVIDSADAQLIAQHIVGIITLTGDDLLAADVNDHDPPVADSADLQLLKQFLVGIITEFPGGMYIP